MSLRKVLTLCAAALFLLAVPAATASAAGTVSTASAT